MRLLLCVSALAAVSAASAYRDGAEYNDEGERIHHRRVYSYRPEHQKEQQQYQGQQQEQFRVRRQNRAPVYRFQRPRASKPSKKSVRPMKPVAKPEAPRFIAEPSNRRENIFVPQNQQRALRPVEQQRYNEYNEQENIVPSYPNYPESYPEIEKEVSRAQSPYPKRSQSPTRREPERVREKVYQQPETYAQQPQRRQQQKPYRESADTYRTSEPFASIDRSYEEKKVFARDTVDFAAADQLEGESFQPAYTPYAAPATAYDAGYAPPEQKSLEAAVAAGAAGYNAESYKEPERLNFQIHGQEGPNSYRFGYDTGVGYNRQFRYEERDNYGVLHGRYGYYDQAGKLQIVNYTADPKGGFHAEGDHVPKPEY